MPWRRPDEQFLFLPVRSSHSSKGGFKIQKQYSTVIIEVGRNYSDDMKEVRGLHGGDASSGPARHYNLLLTRALGARNRMRGLAL